MGVEMLRHRGNNSSYVPLVKKQTSPLIALILSFICPGLGAAYNGQTSKALIYFAVFIGLFQMAILTGGTPLFVFGFMGMWLFAALDSWRTARLIRFGVTPDGAQDIIVQRLSGNPKLWGIVLVVIGGLFFLQMFVHVGHFLKSALPVLLIALGIYLMRDYLFKAKKEKLWNNFDHNNQSLTSTSSLAETSFRNGEFDASTDHQRQSASKSWKSRY